MKSIQRSFAGELAWTNWRRGGPVKKGVQGVIHIGDVEFNVDLLVHSRFTLRVVVKPGQRL